MANNFAFTPDVLDLPLSCFMDEKSYAICVGSSPVNDYDEATHTKKDTISGTRVEVVLPDHKYIRMFVKVPCGFDNILIPNSKIRFEGFSARFYKDFATGDYKLTAKASSVIVVK